MLEHEEEMSTELWQENYVPWKATAHCRNKKHLRGKKVFYLLISEIITKQNVNKKSEDIQKGERHEQKGETQEGAPGFVYQLLSNPLLGLELRVCGTRLQPRCPHCPRAKGRAAQELSAAAWMLRG